MNVPFAFFIVSLLLLPVVDASASQLRSGFTATAGFSLGIPYGDGGSGDGTPNPIGDYYSSGVRPIDLSVGYYITPSDVVSGYGSIAIPIAYCDDFTAYDEDGKELYIDNENCSAAQLRFGISWTHKIQTSSQLKPWFELGVGVESFGEDSQTTVSYVEDPNVFLFSETTTSLFGWEGSATAGIDLKVSEMLSVGPFISLSAGQFLDYSVEISYPNGELSNIEDSGSISYKAFHGWVLGGLRVTLN